MGNCCRKVKLLYYEKIKSDLEKSGKVKDVPAISAEHFLDLFEKVEAGERASFCVLDVREPHEIEKISLPHINEVSSIINFNCPNH